MDPLESFIEVSQWTGSTEEARERINAAGGDVSLALEHLYSGFLDNEQPNDPAEPQGTNASALDERQSQPRANNQNSAPTKSLMDELNSEYTQDLVKNPASRLQFPGPVLYILSIPIITTVAAKLTALLHNIGFSKFLPTVEEVSFEAKEARPRYYKNVINPLLKSVASDAVERVTTLQGYPYNDVLEKVKSKLGYLLVVITNEVDPEANKQLLKALQKTGIFAEQQLDFWFGSVLTYEGLAVAESLGFSQTPGLALIAPSPKTAQSNIIVMERLFKLEGDLSGPEISVNVRASISNHEPKLISLRLERQQFDVDRHIREEQDSAYERSLQADRIRAEQAKAEKSKAEEESKKEENKAQLHKKWQSSVLKRANKVQAPPSASDVKLARIGIRLPDGKRIPLGVPGETTLEDLYSVVYVHLHPDEIEEIEDDSSGLDDYEADYGLGLVSPVLRKKLSVDSTPIKDVEALWPSGIVMVDIE